MPEAPAAIDGGDPAAPIFVVGTPRSGTTLFAAMLDAHPRIACGPETAFFRFATTRERRRILHDRNWPEQAVRFLLSLRRLRAGSVLEAYGLTEGDVRTELAGQPPSLQSVLEAIVVPHARRQGKPRWVEKTPVHVMHVEELRQLWPRSTIFRVVRDPRAVAASTVRVPFGPGSATGAAYLWRHHDEAALAFFTSDPRARTIRYEDLVADPEAVLRDVCALLGEAFAPEMLEPGPDQNLAASAEQWKWRSVAPIDQSRVAAWRQELEPLDQGRVALVCAEGMNRWGYEGAREAEGIVRVHVLRSRVRDAAGLIEPAADAGYLLADAPADASLASPMPQVVFAPGDPGMMRAAAQPNPRSLVRLFVRLAASRLRGRPVTRARWPEGKAPRRSSRESVAEAIVLLLTRRSTPDEIAGIWSDVVASQP
jgi:hypothetical protein